MTLLFNKKLQKSQIHGDWVKLANFRGEFTNPGSLPGDGLTYDTWLYTGTPISFSSLRLNPDDVVQKLVDEYCELTAANVAAQKWTIRRNLTSAQMEWIKDAADGILKVDRVMPLSDSFIDLYGFVLEYGSIDLGEF
jgi:hypothetical protein